jgi:flagellar protein FliO/FliZ
MNSVPDLWATAATGVAAMLLLLVVLAAALLWLRRAGQRAAGSGTLVRTVASSYVGVKKMVSLVEIPGAVLVLGLSGDRIQLLATIDDPERVARITGPGARRGPAASFSDQLQRAFSRLRRDRDTPPAASPE